MPPFTAEVMSEAFISYFPLIIEAPNNNQRANSPEITGSIKTKSQYKMYIGFKIFQTAVLFDVSDATLTQNFM